MIQHNVYEGRHQLPEHDYVVLKNGVPLDPARSLAVRNHSPTGFAWSYSGSGPAQLALALLLEETDNQRLAETHYQAFKAEVIARLPRDQRWTITSADIRRWIANHWSLEDDRAEEE
jgi:hypothetical protein